MKNIGILGPAGSGKGTAADFFVKKHKYKSITMSDSLRAIARKKKIKPTRENLEKIQREYRKKYGEDFVARESLKKVKGKNHYVLDGLRTLADIRLIKNKLKAKIILVTASPEARFQRLKKRKRTGFPKTIKDFKKMEAHENKIFNFKKVFKHADYKVSNSKNKKELYRSLSRLTLRLR